MAQLLVRNVEDGLVARLKARAAAHGRSVEAEHREILRTALDQAADARRAAFRDLAERLQRETSGRTFTPSEILQQEGRSER
jgi:plasmid stability protein